MLFKIFLTNLGKYNEGQLVGEWLSLPISHKELEKVFDRIGINEEYEEYFITDYDTSFGFSIDEYENLTELNELAQELDELDTYDNEIIEALTEDGYTLKEALEMKDDCIIYRNCKDMTDIANQYVDETGLLDSVPDAIARYFDYEALGRDINLEGHFIFTQYGNCVEVRQ